MVKELRKEFNSRFTDTSYRRFLQRMDERIGMSIVFHICETPVFVSDELRKRCEQAAIEIAMQAHSPECVSASDATLQPAYTVPNQSSRSLFTVVDFAMTVDADGEVQPRLIELQGFPSLFGFQLLEAELIHEHFGLPSDVGYINGNHSRHVYLSILRKAICADEDPEQVVLLEFDPWNQKTSPDFHATKELLDIGVVDIRTVKKVGNQLSYERDGRTVPIRRIYNRAIVDELVNENVTLPFDWRDELDVQWAGHPNWYFRISKFLLPMLNHPAAPRTHFLNQLTDIPSDLDNYVLKPLYSFAGSGVIVGPSHEDVEAIAADQRSNYVLQERVHYGGVLDTPFGPTKVELRFMLIWLPDEPKPRAVMNLVRTGRGSLMGVRHNKDLPWTGSSALFMAQ